MRLCLRLLVANVFQKKSFAANTFPVKAHCFVLDCIYRHALFLTYPTILPWILEDF